MKDRTMTLIPARPAKVPTQDRPFHVAAYCRVIQAGFQRGTTGYQNFACYGYRFDAEKQGLVIVPKEAEVVRLIFGLRLRGLSYGMIAGELERKSIPSPAGKP